MSSQLNAYISFNGNARQAMEFYQTVFGGVLSINTYAEFQPGIDPEHGGKTMHSMLRAENGITFMASDVPPGMPPASGSSINMSLSGDNHDELSGYYRALSAGGMEIMPLAAAPWGSTFGIVADQFGIIWLVNITPA